MATAELVPAAAISAATPPTPQRRDIASYQFKPGQSGNPSGRPKGQRFRSRTLREFNDALSKSTVRGDRVVAQLFEQAEAGNLDAIQLIRDTLDGPANSNSGTTIMIASNIMGADK